jgi:hypothetical protein
MNKKGYYFTLDAIIGIIILVTGAVIINYAYFDKPHVEPPLILANDIADSFEKTRIDELESKAPLLYESDTNIEDISGAERTILEQIGIYYQQSQDESDPDKKSEKLDKANNLASSFITKVIPKQYNFQIKIKDHVLVQDSNNKKEKDASQVVVAKKLVYTTYEDAGIPKTVGPLKFEVKMWQ